MSRWREQGCGSGDDPPECMGSAVHGPHGCTCPPEPVCPRCQHRECVCKPPERMLRASEVASVLRRIRDALNDKVGTAGCGGYDSYGPGYDSGLNRAIAEIEDVAKDVLGIDLDKLQRKP